MVRSSMYHASCLPDDAADADLIIVELTLNDSTGLELDISKSPSKRASSEPCPASGFCNMYPIPCNLAGQRI